MTGHTLQTADRIGLLGPFGRDLDNLRTKLLDFRKDGIDVVIHLGPFGVIDRRQSTENDLTLADAMLGELGQIMYLLDSNNELTRLAPYPTLEDGTRWVRTNIFRIPRGHALTLASGKVLAAWGGTDEMDRGIPRRAEDQLWPVYISNRLDIGRLAGVHADILVGHAELLPEDQWDLARKFEPGSTRAHKTPCPSSSLLVTRAMTASGAQVYFGAATESMSRSQLDVWALPHTGGANRARKAP